MSLLTKLVFVITKWFHEWFCSCKTHTTSKQAYFDMRGRENYREEINSLPICFFCAKQTMCFASLGWFNSARLCGQPSPSSSASKRGANAQTVMDSPITVTLKRLTEKITFHWIFQQRFCCFCLHWKLEAFYLFISWRLSFHIFHFWQV